MEYGYIAIDHDGNKKKGKLEANDQKEVVEYLRAENFTILTIKNLSKNPSIFGYFKGVKNSDIILFTRQLSSMLMTGLTVIESLNVLKQENNKPEMQSIVNSLIANLSEGKSLSKSLENYPNQFSKVYIALIKSAEEGGILDKVLERLADNLEKTEDIHKKVKSALFYPAIVISGVIAVIILMNVFVIPQMGTLYESLDIELPLTTRIVLGISKLTTIALPFMVVSAVGLFISYRKYKNNIIIVNFRDNLKMNLPIFGPITNLSILAEVLRTIALLTSAGTSLIQSLKIAAEVSGNVTYKKALDNSSELVEKGTSLSVALQNQNLFPPLVIQMVKVGESTGKIDESLLKVSEYFERDLDLRVKTLTTAIEPILIIVLGVSVGFLILSVITPIYSLISQIQ